LKVPVLIVGGGPCGMLLSALLSRYRVPSLLLERGGDQPMSHPRAHVLNARSMEILRKVSTIRDVSLIDSVIDAYRSLAMLDVPLLMLSL